MNQRRFRISLVLAVFVVTAATPESAHAAFNTAAIDWAIKELCGHINGHLGGLLTTVAAFGALIAAAFGTFRVFHGAIITAVGAFAIANILSLNFTEAADLCLEGEGAAAAGAPPRTVPGELQSHRQAPNGDLGLQTGQPNLNLDGSSSPIAGAPAADDDLDPASRVVD